MEELCLKGGKVVGTIECLQYDKSTWDAMTKEQRDKAMEHCKAKSSQCAVKTATTLGPSAPLSEMEDTFEKLTRAVKSIESSHGHFGRLADCN